jgi:uncharacterized protein YjbJ (UPF0337 family)
MDSKYNQAMGKMKNAAGEAMGDDRMQSEGTAQNMQGQAQGMMGKAQGMMGKAQGMMQGGKNEGMGDMSCENTSGQMKDNLQEAAGKAQQKWNS